MLDKDSLKSLNVDSKARTVVRHRSLVPKPGDHPSNTATAWGTSGLPRRIRARLARSPRKAKPGSKAEAQRHTPPSPHSPHQEAAVSRAGKVALGPWGGPFGASAATQAAASAAAGTQAALALPATIYLDREGSGHFGLSEDEDRMVRDVFDALRREEAADSAASARAARAAGELALARAASVRARAAVDAAQGGARRKARGAASGIVLPRRSRVINQPRRMN